MKLTELKNKIDEALKLHDDYDVKILTGKVPDCSISSDRSDFNIHIDVPEGEEYHIVEEEDMEYCRTCELYHLSGKECPGCKLKKF